MVSMSHAGQWFFSFGVMLDLDQCLSFNISASLGYESSGINRMMRNSSFEIKEAKLKAQHTCFPFPALNSPAFLTIGCLLSWYQRCSCCAI